MVEPPIVFVLWMLLVQALAALCEVLECQPGDLLRWEPSADGVMPAAGDAPAARA